MTAFGCPYTGKISIEDIVQLLLKLSYMGASEVVLVDSTGMANPRSVQSTLRILLDLQLDINLAVHFHNTRGAAIANCVAAYDAGIRIFDTSLGGMSATPYGVSELDIGCWNVPTEDLVHLFEEMGVKTGVDLEKLLDCVRLAEQMAGMHLPGHLLRAGRSSQNSRDTEASGAASNYGSINRGGFQNRLYFYIQICRCLFCIHLTVSILS